MTDLALSILITAKDVGASNIVQSIGSTIQSSLATSIVSAAALAGTALAGLSVRSIQAAADFQQTMLQVQALAGVSAQEAKAAEQAIMQMSVNVGQAPKTLAEGLYYIASAGYTAKDSLYLLELSSKAAAVGSTETTVTANALTAALKAFNLPASEAGKVMDMMVKTVSTGKTEFEDYAKIIGKVSLNAQQAGVTFAEANAAFATLTNVMPSSKQAADSLNALLQTSSRFDLLADRAGRAGIAFDSNAYKSMNLQQRMQYLMEITGGSAEAMTNLLDQSNATAAATALATGNFENYNNALKSVTTNSGALEAAFEKTSSGFNASMSRMKAAVDVLLIAIGNNLLPIATSLVDAVTPIVSAFASWIASGNALSDTMKFLSDNANIIVPILSGIGAMILAILVPAFIAWAISAGSAAIATIAATWPILAIGVAIAGLVAGFMALYNNNAQFKAFIDGLVKGFQQIWSTISANFMPAMNQAGGVLQQVGGIFQQIGAWLLATFTPVWNQLVTTIQTQVVPAWNNLMTGLAPLIPTFQQIASFIGIVIVGAIVLLISFIGGLVGAIAGALPGIIQAFGGVITFISGFIQVIAGIIALIVDLFTGNFDKLGTDLQVIFSGIGQMFSGWWQFISGLFSAAIGWIVGYVTGFWQTLVGIFTALWDNLVGHSIIPDMIAGIVSAFLGMGPQAIIGIISFIADLTTKFTQLATDAINWGKGLIAGFIDGVKSMVSAAGEAASGIIAEVGKFMKFESPAQAGPGAQADTWAPALISMYASGLADGAKQIQAASEQLMIAMQLTFQQGFLQLNLIVQQGVLTMTQTLSFSWTSMIQATTLGMQQMQLAISTSLQQTMLLFTTWWLQLLLLHQQQMIKLGAQLQLDWKKIQTELQISLKLIETDIKKAWDAVLTYLKGQQKLIETAMTTPFKNAQTQIKSIMQQISSDVSSQVSSMISKLKSVEQAASSAKAAVASVPSVPAGGPNVQSFASGIENFAGGLAYVHKDEVLVNLARGTDVIPAKNVSFGVGGKGSPITVNYSPTFNVPGRGREEIRELAEEVNELLARDFKDLLATISTGGTSI